MIQIAILLALLPVAALNSVLNLSDAQRARPLPQRNVVRATRGCIGIVVLAAIWLNVPQAHTYPYDRILYAAGGISLVYLVVGASGSRGVQFDIMSVLWLLAGVGFCGWMLTR
jgi:hypothetical protein